MDAGYRTTPVKDYASGVDRSGRHATFYIIKNYDG